MQFEGQHISEAEPVLEIKVPLFVLLILESLWEITYKMGRDGEAVSFSEAIFIGIDVI